MKNKFLNLVLALLIPLSITVQSQEKVGIPQLGDKAPSFTAESTEGKIKFPGDYGKSWKILLSHPKDFTPVCSSELLELAYLQDEFNVRNVKIAVISTDLLSQHKDWKRALEDINYKGRESVELDFPLISDESFDISKSYGLIHEKTSRFKNVRGVFIIDPENTIRSVNFYPIEVGRNMDEILRTLVALQTSASDQTVYTPANWKPGDDVLVGTLSKEEKANMGSPGSDYYQEAWFLTFKKLGQDL